MTASLDTAVPESPITPQAALDISPDFQSELAAILTSYGSRIAAARSGSLPSSMAIALVNALRDELNIALRELMNRWQAAARNQAIRAAPGLSPRATPESKTLH